MAGTTLAIHEPNIKEHSSTYRRIESRLLN